MTDAEVSTLAQSVGRMKSVADVDGIRATQPPMFYVETDTRHMHNLLMFILQCRGSEEDGIYKDFSANLEWVRQNYKPVDVFARPVQFVRREKK